MSIILSLVFVYLLKYGLLVIVVVACSRRSVCSSRIGLLWYGVFSVYDAFCLCGCSENRMLIRWPGNVACVVCCRIWNSELSGISIRRSTNVWWQCIHWMIIFISWSLLALFGLFVGTNFKFIVTQCYFIDAIKRCKLGNKHQLTFNLHEISSWPNQPGSTS